MRRFGAGAILCFFWACSSATQSTDPVEPEPEPIVVIPAADPQPPVPQGNRIDATTLSTIVACWFDSPYSYMFDSGGIQVGNGRFGMLQAGVRGILYYGDLNTCAGDVSGHPPRSYSDDTPFAALSGLAIHSDQMNENQPFGFINPAIIEWGRANLLPEPDAMVLGVSVLDIYQSVFSQFFRSLTESYVTLVDTARYEDDQAAYWAMAQGGGGDGIEWLEATYGGQLPQYPSMSDAMSWTAPMSFGFWLRRGIDGTADELWAGLREINQRFDSQWYQSIQNTYRSTHIDW